VAAHLSLTNETIYPVIARGTFTINGDVCESPTLGLIVDTQVRDRQMNNTIARLLISLLESWASDHETTARLWETDLEAFGTTPEGIANWRGHGEGLKQAADLIKSTCDEPHP